MKKRTRKAIGLALCAVLSFGMLTGCGSSSSNSGSSDTENTASSESNASDESTGVSGEISVVSREDGSGTRSAFVELTGVEEKDADGNKIDNTTVDAIVANSTEIVMTTVEGDENAIGYISLGSMSDSVKGLQVDGVDPTAENIINGTYTLSRPFNIVTKGDVSEVAQDFIDFIMSEDGQKVISDNGYIEVDNSGAFKSNGASGKVVVAGSSSVTPVMEKLQEAYQAVNGKVEIEIQESDSTTGVNFTAEGTCDIGMASRDLSDEESGKGLTATAIAMDGIVTIVNNANQITGLTKDQINDIFRGNITDWADVK